MTPRTRIAIPSLQVRVADPSDPAAVSAAVDAALKARLAGSPAAGRIGDSAREIGGRVALKARSGGVGR